MTGKLKDIIHTFENKFRVLFEVDSVDELRGMENKELSIEVKAKRHKRSLSANAYFHVLVGKIADAMKISKTRSKNMLLGRYGQREILENTPLVITVAEKVDMLELEYIHCVQVGFGHVNNKKFIHWAVVRGSHTYDTAEMSVLIDGTVQEAKELGIETLPPAELELMKKAWSQYYNKNASATYAEPQSDWTNIM